MLVSLYRDHTTSLILLLSDASVHDKGLRFGSKEVRRSRQRQVSKLLQIFLTNQYLLFLIN